MARNIGGQYQLACEASPNKLQIDTWLNEGKPIQWISDQLKAMGDYISTNSISKYKKYRDTMIREELEKEPQFIAKQQAATEIMNTSIGKIKEVDVLGEISTLIEDSADLLADAKYRDIKINSIKDLRMVQQTMLEAISTYADVMLDAQKFQAINDDPTLLKQEKTTININVKSALTDILKEAMQNGGEGYKLIDSLRASISNSN